VQTITLDYLETFPNTQPHEDIMTINLRCRGAVAGFVFATAVVFCTPDLAAQVTVTSFTPTQGVAGTPVQITGQNFFVVSNVRFNGVNADFSVHRHDVDHRLCSANCDDRPDFRH
jgi:hypothetical protein